MKYLFLGLIIIRLCQCSSSDNSNMLSDENNSFNNELNNIILSYIEHMENEISYNENRRIIMVYFELKELDTVLTITSGKYLGAFLPESSLDWRLMVNIGGYDLVIGDSKKMIGKGYYNINKLTPFEVKDKFYTLDNYVEQKFHEQIWVYNVHQGEIELSHKD